MLQLVLHKLDMAAAAAVLAGMAMSLPSSTVIKNSLPSQPMKALVMADGRKVSFSVYQVSKQDWAMCNAAKACELQVPKLAAPRQGQEPMVGLNYFDARQFITWINGRTGQTYRLPTAAEWQMAAQNLPQLSYKKLFTDPRLAWAADYDAMPAISSTLRGQGGFGYLPNGLADLGGNVWEWTSTCAMQGMDEQTCPAFNIEGAHETKMSEFIRDPVVGGCSAGRPPTHLGLRLVRDE